MITFALDTETLTSRSAVLCLRDDKLVPVASLNADEMKLYCLERKRVLDLKRELPDFKRAVENAGRMGAAMAKVLNR